MCLRVDARAVHRTSSGASCSVSAGHGMPADRPASSLQRRATDSKPATDCLEKACAAKS